MNVKGIFEALEKEFDIMPAGPPWPIDIDERIKFEKAGTFLVINKLKYEELKRSFLTHNMIDDDYLWRNTLLHKLDLLDIYHNTTTFK